MASERLYRPNHSIEFIFHILPEEMNLPIVAPCFLQKSSMQI